MRDDSKIKQFLGHLNFFGILSIIFGFLFIVFLLGIGLKFIFDFYMKNLVFSVGLVGTTLIIIFWIYSKLK